MSSNRVAPQTVWFPGSGDLTLAADEWNRGAGASGRPTVLMLHGGGQNRHSWHRTGQTLAADGFHVVALDSRGHGDSDRAEGSGYSLESLTEDVLRVIDAIGRPVAVVGASLGGLTGIAVAEKAGPERVSKLVLVDIVPRSEPRGVTRILEFMTGHMDGFDTLDDAADAIAAYLPQRDRPTSVAGLTKNLREREGRWYWHWDPTFLDKRDIEEFMDVDVMEQAAASLAIPILLIRGKLSDVVSVEAVEDFLGKVPGAELVELSNAGHTAAGDDNDAFSDAVVRFVSR